MIINSGIILAACGIIVLLAGFWGGSWLLSVFPTGSPYNFAAFLTSFVVILVGLVLVFVSGAVIFERMGGVI